MNIKDKMPSVRIILKKVNTADKHGYLYLRIKHKVRTEPFLQAMGYKIEEKYWDKAKERVRDSMPMLDDHTYAHHINEHIGKEVMRCIELFRKLIDGGQMISPYMIQAVIEGDIAVNGSFLQFVRMRIDFMAKEMKDGQRAYSDGYIRHLWVEYRSLERFAGKDKDIMFADVDTTFLERYEAFIANDIRSTTLHTKIKRLKEFIALAQEKDLIRSNALRGYKTPVYLAPERPYLTAEQVDAIAKLAYQHKLTGDMLAVACFFVVECYSGLRFSDWPRFRVETVIDKQALRVRALKNDKPVYLYLHTFKKLGKMCHFIINNNIPAPTEERKTNTCIPLITGLANSLYDAGINFHCTTHTGRHTAATLLAMLGYTDSEGALILGITPDTFRLYRNAVGADSRHTQERLGGL